MEDALQEPSLKEVHSILLHDLLFSLSTGHDRQHYQGGQEKESIPELQGDQGGQEEGCALLVGLLVLHSSFLFT